MSPDTHHRYVDPNGGSVLPFLRSMLLTPFGGAPIGQQNISFIGFEPADVSKSFDIDPQSIKKCQKAQSCDDSAALRHTALAYEVCRASK